MMGRGIRGSKVAAKRRHWANFEIYAFPCISLLQGCCNQAMLLDCCCRRSQLIAKPRLASTVSHYVTNHRATAAARFRSNLHSREFSSSIGLSDAKGKLSESCTCLRLFLSLMFPRIANLCLRLVTIESPVAPNFEPEKTPEDAPLNLSQNVREKMRPVAHSIAVVTVPSEGAQETKTETTPLPEGLLISSFNTVSLEPDPIVSFNIKVPSRTYDAIARSEKFDVSPLWNLHTAIAFAPDKGKAKKKQSQPFPSAQELARSRLFGLRCEWLKEKSVEIGDHVVMLGKIIGVLDPVDSRKSLRSLVYANGYYRFTTASAHATLYRSVKSKKNQGGNKECAKG